VWEAVGQAAGRSLCQRLVAPSRGESADRRTFSCVCHGAESGERPGGR